MRYLDKIDWDVLKKDLQKNLEKGMEAVKKGAVIAKTKAGELTEEGKKQYKILTLNMKVQQGISDLGARVYTLLSSKPAKNPLRDARVKEIMALIEKNMSEIDKIEGKGGKAPSKARRKKVSRAAGRGVNGR